VIGAVVFDGVDLDEFGPNELEAARDAPGTTWVRATAADPAELERVAETFDIHPLSVEDVRGDVRPKTEEFTGHTFVLVKTATFRTGETAFDEEVRTRPVGLFVGRDWLVTLSTGDVAAVDRVWDALDRGEARLRGAGPDFLAYRVVDRIVDDYFTLLDEVGDLIEAVEEGIVEDPDPEVLVDLNAVRRDLLSLRKVLWPTREAAAVLARGDPDEVRQATEKYYRDVYDHLVQLVDLVETYRDLARGARDIYLNAVSQSTNEVMKRLTVVATIILPLTFVVGVFGMNFGGDSALAMPELLWPSAYPAVVLGMAAVSVILLVYFREEGSL
jgi:magnesium transporter